jgi:hypothetical protein
VFSIVLSSCGKKDKSNDFVRATPVESQESFEYLEYPESPTLIKTSTPTTCDGFAPCRFVRDHWQYEMINVFDVAITPKRVFWTAVVLAYPTYRAGKFSASLLCSPSMSAEKRRLYIRRLLARHHSSISSFKAVEENP